MTVTYPEVTLPISVSLFGCRRHEKQSFASAMACQRMMKVLALWSPALLILGMI
ncbi:hypothetical protein [Dapis sp. BLCC M172]|uniref:hypothetical protein n=1 Tax=Dapis sp. BLCC M172 TaxID=2975281 RepID=UPI003CE9A08A